MSNEKKPEPVTLMSVDPSKVNNLSKKLVDILGNLPEDIRGEIMCMIGNAMEVVASLEAKTNLANGFRGMGANILTENAGRMPHYIRQLGRGLDRLYKAVDPTALDPIPDLYGDWLKANHDMLVSKYNGTSVAIHHGKDGQFKVVAFGKHGDYRGIFKEAVDKGFHLGEISIARIDK